MTETPCPFAWCRVEGDHIFHFAHVGLLDDPTVMVFAVDDGPAEVVVTAYEPGGTTRTAGIPQTVLPLAAARTLGDLLVARGRDTGLGRALVAAADLAESGGE